MTCFGNASANRVTQAEQMSPEQWLNPDDIIYELVLYFGQVSLLKSSWRKWLFCQLYVFGINLPIKSFGYWYDLKREICSLSRILQLSPQRALLITRLILKMDILMKEDYNVRVELKELIEMAVRADQDPSDPPDSLTPSSFLDTLTVTLGPWEVCRSDTWLMMSEFGDSEGIIKWTGTSLEGGACGFTCIDKAAVSVCWATSSRATVIAGASHASFVCIGFFQADYC